MTDTPPEEAAGSPGEGRRTFIKKLAYVTPVMTTFLLSQTAFAADEDGDGLPGEGRHRGRTSPHPGRGRGHDDGDDTPPPPPPP